MPQTTLQGPRVSTLQRIEVQVEAGNTNEGCHGNTDGVQPNDKAILANVRVVLIGWGKFYSDHPEAMDNAAKLCSDVVTGPYFNGLAQYGVGRGSFDRRITVPDNSPPSTLSQDDARQKLVGWMRDGTLNSPAIDETSLLYVLLPPPQTKPTIASGQDDFCGYHQWTKYNNNSRNDDLFWALVRTDKADQSSGTTLVNGISYCMSHEMAEAVTSRDGRGYHNGSCEIGDLCEAGKSGSIKTFRYRNWDVEQYWSEWDRSCINGDTPVSLRRFLQASKRTGGSLRALGTPAINVEYIASQCR